MPADGRTPPLPERARGDGGSHENGDAAIDVAHWESAYAALRELAAMRLASIPRGPTFQPTDVLHEAFVRILSANRSAGRSEGSSLPAAAPDLADPETEARAVATLASAIRSVLVDRVRRRCVRMRHLESAAREQSQKAESAEQGIELLALDEALTRLAGVDERAARIVELRYFAGLSNKDAATLLGISSATAERDWRFARAWLSERLGITEAALRPAIRDAHSQNPDAGSPA